MNRPLNRVNRQGRPLRAGRRLTRRGALGLLSAAAAGVLGGCTALPNSSGVTRSGVAASDTDALIETAPGPGEGDSAEDVVNGFLRAAIAGFSDDFATAKQFLTERTAAQWKPLETVSAYSGSTEPQVSVAADGAFTVTSGQVGVLDSLGVFTPAEEGATYVGEFSLATNSTGQWRIVGLPHGILLPFSRLMQNFAVSALAFLSWDRAAARRPTPSSPGCSEGPPHGCTMGPSASSRATPSARAGALSSRPGPPPST